MYSHLLSAIIPFYLCASILFSLYTPLEAKTKENRYSYEVAACLMFYNEAYYLKEWLEYHKLIGIEHFYLFDNGSTDHFMEILEPYIRSGEVELYHYPQRGENQQEHNHIQCNIIYTRALELARGKAKWLAIIDADEFIYPVRGKSLPKILKLYKDAGGLYVDYLFFGTAHVEQVPQDKLILESLNLCADKPKAFGKSIVRPERVSHCTDPHRMWYHPPYFHVDTSFNTFDWTPSDTSEDILLLFHYYLGDKDHAMNVTFPRRKRWIGIQPDSYLESCEWMNARLNTSMQRFVPALRKKIFSSHQPS